MRCLYTHVTDEKITVQNKLINEWCLFFTFTMSRHLGNCAPAASTRSPLTATYLQCHHNSSYDNQTLLSYRLYRHHLIDYAFLFSCISFMSSYKNDAFFFRCNGRPSAGLASVRHTHVRLGATCYDFGRWVQYDFSGTNGGEIKTMFQWPANSKWITDFTYSTRCLKWFESGIKSRVHATRLLDFRLSK